MSNDERQIRELVATWMAATKAGDIDTVLTLMAEDVVFLIAGREPMIGKEAYAATARGTPGQPAPRFEGASDIQEIKVLGDWAFMWTKLTVVATLPSATKAMTRAGHTLSVLKKEDGRWVLTRDANMLMPVPE